MELHRLLQLQGQHGDLATGEGWIVRAEWSGGEGVLQHDAQGYVCLSVGGGCAEPLVLQQQPTVCSVSVLFFEKCNWVLSG